MHFYRTLVNKKYIFGMIFCSVLSLYLLSSCREVNIALYLPSNNHNGSVIIHNPPPLNEKKLRIGLFMYADSGYDAQFGMAIGSMQCYAAQKGYMYFKESRSYEEKSIWSKVEMILKYLPYVDYLLLVDADVFVANWTKRIEDLIDDRYDISLVERFHNQEIASCCILFKNSEFSLRFVRDWASWKSKPGINTDNGSLHPNLARYILSNSTQDQETLGRLEKEFQDLGSKGFGPYFQFVKDVKSALYSKADWGRITIAPALHGFFRCLERVGNEYKGEMWDHWLGNEFLVHSKYPGNYITKEHAECRREFSGFVKPELLPQ